MRLFVVALVIITAGFPLIGPAVVRLLVAASEPVWLALWGSALVGVACLLRATVGSNSAANRPVASATQLKFTDSLTRSA